MNMQANGVIAEFFERMESEGVHYAVLRNYGMLPEAPDPKGDVDILIPEYQAASFQRILKESVEERGGQIFFTRHRFHCDSYFIFVPGSPAIITWIDAFTRIATRGVPWMETASLLKERVRHHKKFFTLSSGAESATLLIKEILGGRPLREKYQKKIIELLKQPGSAEIFTRLLSASFGKKHASQMLDLAQAEKWNEAFKKKGQWRRALVVSVFRKEPLRQTGRFFQFFLGHIARGFFNSCHGGLVAVLGPDGVGKTTACRNLQELLKKWPFRRVLYYHGEFGVFPSLGKIYRWLMKPWRRTGQPEPSRHEQAGPLRAFIHLLYYGLEFFLAWPWVIWGRWRGYCFIFDRFYYDFSLRSAHRRMYRLIIRIIPRPDIIILLKAPPQLIYERKQELTVAQIEEQLSEFQQLHKNAMILSTEQPGEELVSKMEEAIVHQFSKKP